MPRRRNWHRPQQLKPNFVQRRRPSRLKLSKKRQKRAVTKPSRARLSSASSRSAEHRFLLQDSNLDFALNVSAGDAEFDHPGQPSIRGSQSPEGSIFNRSDNISYPDNEFTHSMLWGPGEANLEFSSGSTNFKDLAQSNSHWGSRSISLDVDRGDMDPNSPPQSGSFDGHSSSTRDRIHSWSANLMFQSDTTMEDIVFGIPPSVIGSTDDNLPLQDRHSHHDSPSLKALNFSNPGSFSDLNVEFPPHVDEVIFGPPHTNLVFGSESQSSFGDRIPDFVNPNFGGGTPTNDWGFDNPDGPLIYPSWLPRHQSSSSSSEHGHRDANLEFSDKSTTSKLFRSNSLGETSNHEFGHIAVMDGKLEVSRGFAASKQPSQSYSIDGFQYLSNNLVFQSDMSLENIDFPSLRYPISIEANFPPSSFHRDNSTDVSSNHFETFHPESDLDLIMPSRRTNTPETGTAVRVSSFRRDNLEFSTDMSSSHFETLHPGRDLDLLMPSRRTNLEFSTDYSLNHSEIDELPPPHLVNLEFPGDYSSNEFEIPKLKGMRRSNNLNSRLAMTSRPTSFLYRLESDIISDSDTDTETPPALVKRRQTSSKATVKRRSIEQNLQIRNRIDRSQNLIYDGSSEFSDDEEVALLEHGDEGVLKNDVNGERALMLPNEPDNARYEDQDDELEHDLELQARENLIFDWTSDESERPAQGNLLFNGTSFEGGDKSNDGHLENITFHSDISDFEFQDPKGPTSDAMQRATYTDHANTSQRPAAAASTQSPTMYAIAKEDLDHLYLKFMQEFQKSNEGHTSSTAHQQAHKGYNKKPRTSTTKALHEDIRSFAFSFMKRANIPGLMKNRSPIYTATLADVKAFNKKPTDLALGPRASNFVLDFHGGSASPWNKRATQIFTAEFIRSGKYRWKDRSAISKAFKTHIFQLKNQYKKYSEDLRNLRNAERNGDNSGVLVYRERAVQEARIARRRGIRERRCNACVKFLAHPDMKRYLELWDILPMEAISGDETDHHEGELRYIVTSLPWRAPWIREWMIIFDRLHLATRFQPSGRATPGAFPHIRIPSRSTRIDRVCITAPASLPRNFYDPAWLRKQSPEYITMLDMQPEIDLTFSAELLRIAATCQYVISHKTPPIPMNDPHITSIRTRQ